MLKQTIQIIYNSVSQPMGRGPLVGPGALLVGRQDFFIALYIATLGTNFIKIIKSEPY